MTDPAPTRGCGGCTLIELMVALTIMAILAATAVPAYRDFSIRAKVAECINGAAAAKVAISECRQTLGPWPSAGADAGPGGAAGDSRFCNGFVAYEAETGSFTIDVDEADIDGGIPGQISLRMTPGESPSNIINWNCTSGTTPVSNVKYLPATCRDA